MRRFFCGLQLERQNNIRRRIEAKKSAMSVMSLSCVLQAELTCNLGKLASTTNTGDESNLISECHVSDIIH